MKTVNLDNDVSEDREDNDNDEVAGQTVEITSLKRKRKKINIGEKKNTKIVRKETNCG